MEPRNRQSRSVNVSSSRWMAYAVAGLATASGGAISAEGAIHYSGAVQLRLDSHRYGFSYNLLPLSGGASLDFFRIVTPEYGATDSLRIFGNESLRVRAPAYHNLAKLHRNQNVSSGHFRPTDAPLIYASHGVPLTEWV